MRKSFRWAGISAALLAGAVAVLPAGPASGAGFSIFESGSRATAVGGAFAATPDDLSAMFYNPAGVASNDKLSVMVGDTLIFPSSKFTGDNPYPGAGYEAKQKNMIFFPPNFYVAYPIVPKKLNIGLGTWFPFGLSTAWRNPDDFRGRFLSQRVDLRQYSLGLQLSWQAADWLAIGAGPELRAGDVKLNRNSAVFNPYTNRFVDAAHVDIVGDGIETDLSWGAGILITPVKPLRLGATYHAKVDQSYSGTATFYQRPTGYADLDAKLAAAIPFGKAVPAHTAISFPSVLMLGIAYDLVPDKLTLEVNADYWKWDVFKSITLAFDTVDGKTVPSSSIYFNYENAWAYRAGLRWQYCDRTWLGVGFVYDQTPQPDEAVSPLLPDANRTGYSIGASFKFGQSTYLDLSNLFLFFHERSTNGHQQDNFNGTYKTFADLFVLNLRTSF